MAAIGRSSPLPARGRFVVDAREYGVSPSNPDNGPALQAAVDAAKALVKSQQPAFNSPPIATVYIPGDTKPYTVNTPVFIDWTNIEVRGDGKASELKSGPQCLPIFVVGMTRGQAGSPAAAYRPDLFGKLDATVATAAGQRWGLRTNGDGYIYSTASPFSHGPVVRSGVLTGWHDTQQLTIDLAVEGFASGQLPGGLHLAGVASSLAGSTYNLTTSSTNTFRFDIFTQPTRYGSATTRGGYAVFFSSGSATGVQRVTVQVDLVSGSVQAYVNGSQVAVTGTPPPAGSFFWENYFVPFSINGTYQGLAAYDSGNGGDFAVYGLNMTQGLRYASNGAGTTQVAHPQIVTNVGNTSTRFLVLPGAPTGGTYTVSLGGATTAPIPAAATPAQIQAALQAAGINVGVGTGSVDPVKVIGYTLTPNAGYTFPPAAPGQCDGSLLTGGTLTDKYRYFPYSFAPALMQDGYSIAYLAFNENPASGPRILSIMAGPVSGGGGVGFATPSYLLTQGTCSAQVANEMRFADLAILTGNLHYGAAVDRCYVLGMNFDRCTISGGMYGVADILYGANYTTYYADCSLQGGHAAVFHCTSAVVMDRCTIGAAYKYGVLCDGVNLTCRDLFVGSYGSDTAAVIAQYDGVYGGQSVIENMSCDFEFGTDLGLALIYNEAVAAGSGYLAIRNIYGGLVGHAPLVKLRCGDQGAVHGPAYLSVDGIMADSATAVVDVDGSLWTGEVRNAYNLGAQSLNCSHLTSDQTWGRPAIQFVDNRSKGFPRVGPWYRGTMKLDVSMPADGQYTRLAVAGDGVVGTASPPQWAGLNPVQSSPSALAAYAIDHTAISATASGQASASGYLNDYGAALLAATLFGTVQGTTATLTLSGSGLGGTFTLSYGGQTTAAIASGATAPQVQSALQALSTVGSGNMAVSGVAGGPYTIALAGTLARLAGGINGLSVNGGGLTGTGASASLSGSSVPTTWYLGLLAADGGRIANWTREVKVAGTGYARAALPNTSASFAAASNGTKATTAAVTWPAAAAPYTVAAIGFYSSPTGGLPFATIKLAAPISVAAGQAVTIPAGAITFAHAPYAGHFAGGLTDYGWGKCFDLLFGGASFAVPATWYAALSTAATTRATTSPAEPSGNGYARAALPANGSTWQVGTNAWTYGLYGGSDFYGFAGDARNGVAAAFGAPTGPWGNLVASTLQDQASGGNAWFQAPLVNPLAPSAGSAAPTFAAGSLVLATA